MASLVRSLRDAATKLRAAHPRDARIPLAELLTEAANALTAQPQVTQAQEEVRQPDSRFLKALRYAHEDDFSQEKPRPEPVAWRDHVEQRLRAWRQRFVNKSGDQLSLDDFMDKESIDDMLDFVLDEWAEPLYAGAEPVARQPQDHAVASQIAEALKELEDAREWLFNGAAMPIIRCQQANRLIHNAMATLVQAERDSLNEGGIPATPAPRG